MLIDLDIIGKQFNDQLSKLATLLLLESRNGKKPLFPDLLYLSAIGARICYSDKPPIEMIQSDERIYSISERVRFLDRLAEAGHTSVFAHSPVFSEYVYSESNYIPLPYKCWWYDEKCGQSRYRRYICANARHLIEFSTDLVAEPLSQLLLHDYQPPQPKTFLIVGDGVSSYSGIPPEPEEKPYILVFFVDKKPWQWFSAIVHGISVIATHQFVRHTWLNFNQRSHRYTQVDDIVVPNRIKGTVLESTFETVSRRCFSFYEEQIAFGIHREDARFILPSGRSTTIMASGPRFVWEDFVKKRNHQRVQWEVRWVARMMDRILEITGEF